MANKACCIEWEQETILYLDNELPDSGRSRVEKHLRQCKYCSALYREMERETHLIGGRLRHLAEAGIPNAVFTNDIMNALPSSAVVSLRGRVKEKIRNLAEVLTGPARIHLAVAASLLICILSIFTTFQFNTEIKDSNITIKRNGIAQQVAMLNPILVSYEDGEFFEFPDGSIAYATKNTLFNIDSYQQGSDPIRIGTDRRIKLIRGEMFFDVEPANEGFNVICTNVKTTVFGTQFLVCTIPEEKQTYIAVREGTVFVEKRGKNQRGSTVLKEQQMTLVFSKNDNIVMRAPHKIHPELLARLNLFDEARSNRKARGILPQSGNIYPDATGIETEGSM